MDKTCKSPAPHDGSRVGVDIGGTLIKISTFNGESSCHKNFQVDLLDDAIVYVNNAISALGVPHVGVTGGGGVRFRAQLDAKLCAPVNYYDEMATIARGFKHLTGGIIPHPYGLLTNIGSGTSVLRIDRDEAFSRVGGVPVGGATFQGLATINSGAAIGIEELVQTASQGDGGRAHLTVGDIYGADYDGLGLNKDIIASYFGKAAHTGVQLSRADSMRGVLEMICDHIGESVLRIWRKMDTQATALYFSGGLISLLSQYGLLDATLWRSLRVRTTEALAWHALPNALHIGSIGAALME